MDLPPPPPQDDDPIITQFKPVDGQCKLTGHNKRIEYETGRTILHYYCRDIKTTPLAVYRYFIETKGCDVNARDNNNDTPVHLAFHCFDPNDGGNITVLTYLLNQMGVNANLTGQFGYTLLHYACRNINKLPLEIFKLLIETIGCDFNAVDSFNNTPFHRAFDYFNQNDGGDLNVLMYLLSQKGINGNIKNRYGDTLLHIACKRINKLPIEIFKLLVETIGCDVNAQDDENNTLLHSVLTRFGQNDGVDITVLIYLLSQKGINVNIKGLFGYTLLPTACDNINKLPLDVFKVLIETQGCDVNAQDNNNNTPLHAALRLFNQNDGGDIKVLMYLLSQNGINGNITGQYGNTLLHRACISINRLPLVVFKLLIETIGCDVNVRGDDDGTPIHRALRYFDPNDGGDTNVLAYLIDQKGINGNINGKKGYNLLHLTCISNLPHSGRLVKSNAEYDTILCQIVEIIVEKCVQQVLDETTP